MSTRGERIDFTAGQGNDTIIGGALNDTIRGNAGDDSLFGGAGNDYLDGGDGWDTLESGTGRDTLMGGGGSDLLLANGGRAVIDGGDDIDLAVILRDDATRAIRIDVRDPSLTHTLDNGTTVVNVERLLFYCGAGNDTLIGGDYSDLVDGGAGHDLSQVGAGVDKAIGGAGIDTLVLPADRADYKLEILDADTIRLTNTSGAVSEIDRVSGIEWFDFTDMTLSLQDLLRPTRRRMRTSTR